MNEHAQLPPQPTSSMKQFDILIGEWNMVGTHPALPSAVQGQSRFEWQVEGALLRWHFDWEPGGPPNALSVIGHDDTLKTCSMLYSDERSVTRIYQLSMEDGVWKQWRDTPEFSQRTIATFSEDRNTITWLGQLSHDGSHWEQDLNVTFTRKQ